MTTLPVRIQPNDSSLAPSARDVVGQATERANALMDIVKKKHLFTTISGKDHLDAEAWQVVAAFDNAATVTDSCTMLRDRDGEPIGYEAKVSILKNGDVISTGIMSCGFDDFPCKGKTGMAQHRAAQSTAQTWAFAKAARQHYAWVAVLAGFEPTPSAEMQSDDAPRDSRPPTSQSRPMAPAKAAAPITPSGDPVTADANVALKALDAFMVLTDGWTNPQKADYLIHQGVNKSWSQRTTAEKQDAVRELTERAGALAQAPQGEV